jgi:hypothetical protein
MLTTSPTSGSLLSIKCVNLNVLKPCGPPWPLTVTALPFYLTFTSQILVWNVMAWACLCKLHIVRIWTSACFQTIVVGSYLVQIWTKYSCLTRLISIPLLHYLPLSQLCSFLSWRWRSCIPLTHIWRAISHLYD